MKFIALLLVIFVAVKARQIESHNYDDTELRQQAEGMLSYVKSISSIAEKFETELQVGLKVISESRPDIHERLSRNEVVAKLTQYFRDSENAGKNVELCEKVMKENADKLVEEAWKELNEFVHQKIQPVQPLMQKINEKRHLLEKNLTENLDKELDMCKKGDHCNLKTKYPGYVDELNDELAETLKIFRKVGDEVEDFLADITTNDEKVKQMISEPVDDCEREN